jgi:hypothetical protein
MTHIKRSRRLQAGLAGLSVFSAMGAAVGLGLTTHTGTTTSQASTTGSTSSTRHSSGGEGDDSSSSTTTSSKQSTSKQSSSQSGPVTQPTQAAPQATTSGS